MKVHISAYLLTKMTTLSALLYFEVDWFASHYNAQVPRFNSKFASPGCSGVDALSLDW